MDDSHRDALLDRYQERTVIPMLILAVLFVPLVAVHFVDSHITGYSRHWLFLAAGIVWGIFVLDFVVQLLIAPHKGKFLRTNWFDLIIVAVPFLRPLAVVWLGAAVGKVGSQARTMLFRNHLLSALMIAFAVMVVGSILVLAVEEPRGGNINSVGNALWWGISTVTTVGYGDVVPITPAGRVIASIVMVSGIALFGVVAANLAAFFVARTSAADTEAEIVGVEGQTKALQSTLEDMVNRMARLERRLDTLGAQDPSKS